VNRPPPTHLRDARLRHALEHAPDAQAAPAEATRAAILRHAHAAVAVAAPPAAAAGVPWWARLARALAGAGRPWNAGFATVLLACAVAGLWWERDVPGPAPDAPSPAPAMPAPAPVPREAPERTDSTAPAREPGADAGAAPPRPAPSAKLSAPSRARSETQERAQAQAQAQSQSQARPQTPSQVPPLRAESDAAEPAPAPAAPPARDPAGLTVHRGARPLAAEAPRPGAAAAPAPMAAPAAPPDAHAWSALRLQPAGAAARTRSSLPADVQQAIDGLLRSGATAVPADDPVLARIALLHEGGLVLGVLELGRYSVRWVPAGDGLPRGFAARVEPATSQTVRDALVP
jgi:hypothetical protein